MSVDLRDSVERWKTHFWEMAQGKLPVESLYFFNQKGQGLGTNPKGHALYKIQTGGQSLSSPVNKGYAMAVGRIKDIEKRKTIERKTSRRKRSSSAQKGIKRIGTSGKIRKVVKRGRSKTSRRKTTNMHKKTTPSKKTTKRKTKKRTTTKRRVKDIFQ